MSKEAQTMGNVVYKDGKPYIITCRSAMATVKNGKCIKHKCNCKEKTYCPEHDEPYGEWKFGKYGEEFDE